MRFLQEKSRYFLNAPRTCASYLFDRSNQLSISHFALQYSVRVYVSHPSSYR